MSNYKAKMTLLADAIRSKSNISNKLTIENMISAIDNISGSSGVDVSGLTALSDNVRSGYTFIGAKGTVQEGTMQPAVPKIHTEGNGVFITFYREGYISLPRNDNGELIPHGYCRFIDFYKCASVAQGEIYYTVSNAIAYPECNGDYYLVDGTEPPMYKHQTAELYLHKLWYESTAEICTGHADENTRQLRYQRYEWDEEGLPESGWEDNHMEDYGLVVTQKMAEPKNKTWTGYKAVWSNLSGYTFEETLTEGLTYGSAFVPKQGGIYDSAAGIEVSKLFEATKPINHNDTFCLIYIDGTTIANQALAPNKHDVTFGNGVTAQDGYLNITNDQSGQILTTAKTDGYGGSLKEWTWDYYFMSDASYLDCSGHSVYRWTVEGVPGNSLFFRGQNTDGKKLGVTFTQNELVGLSLQWDNGILHVWNKGKYVGTCTPTFPNCNGTSFGIGCDESSWNRMADKIKFFRFSNKARYTPGVDFELPEGFVE